MLFLKLGRPGVGYDAWEINRAEVDFYRHIAYGISTPPLIPCHDAAFDDATGCSHILMDDLTDTHTQPPDREPPSFASSMSAVEALAQIHRSGWLPDNAALLANARKFDRPWLDGFVADLEKDIADFRKVAGLNAKQAAMYSKMLENAEKVWGRLLDPSGLTVTHGDAHWWNFLYPIDPSENSVRIFDWHLWHVDLGARDLAFLLALGGFAEPRPEIEQELIGAYHEALGIDGYSIEMLEHDYRISAVRNLNVAIILWKQGKHETTWKDAVRRSTSAFERLECAELF